MFWVVVCFGGQFGGGGLSDSQFGPAGPSAETSYVQFLLKFALVPTHL
jgi:hypothetical protein